MNLKILPLEKAAVVESIFKIRDKKGPGEDYFILSVSDGVKELQTNGKAKEYGIGCQQYTEIIQELSEDLIEADWVTGKGKLDGAAGNIFAYHDEKWIREKFHEYIMRFGFDIESAEGYFFIHLDYKTIKTISDNCIAKYSCTLCYDDLQYCFYVKCKETGEEYIVGGLQKDMQPFEVLLFAFQNHHKHASRTGLNKSGRAILNIKKKPIYSRVYNTKSVVRNELSPFVTLTSDYIKIHTKANLTKKQLDDIERTLSQ